MTRRGSFFWDNGDFGFHKGSGDEDNDNEDSGDGFNESEVEVEGVLKYDDSSDDDNDNADNRELLCFHWIYDEEADDYPLILPKSRLSLDFFHSLMNIIVHWTCDFASSPERKWRAT
jgi:hypothetical protein